MADVIDFYNKKAELSTSSEKINNNDGLWVNMSNISLNMLRDLRGFLLIKNMTNPTYPTFFVLDDNHMSLLTENTLDKFFFIPVTIIDRLLSNPNGNPEPPDILA